MKIFIVIGCEDYESSTPITAFKQRKDADRFLKDCRDFQESLPSWMESNCMEEEEFKIWDTKRKELLKNHPAQRDCEYGFYITEVELI